MVILSFSANNNVSKFFFKRTYILGKREYAGSKFLSTASTRRFSALPFVPMYVHHLVYADRLVLPYSRR